MLIAELFVGRGIRERQPLTDTGWADLRGKSSSPTFPSASRSSTEKANRPTRRPGRIAGGGTKILLVATTREADLAQRLEAVIEAYKARFRQQSVGLITRDSCAAF